MPISTKGGSMLGLELERAIHHAWLNLREKILNDPRELHRRLARRRSRTGQSHVDSTPGLGGNRGDPVPLLSNGKNLLDPAHGNFFAPPHPTGGAHWEFLNHLFPDDFQQTIIRRPHFRRFTPSP